MNDRLFDAWYEAMLNDPSVRDAIIKRAMDIACIPTRSAMPLITERELLVHSDDAWKECVKDGVAIRPFGRFNICTLGYEYFATGEQVPMETWGTNANRIEGANMAAPTLSLYEVYITDRRFTDDSGGAIVVEHSRAASAEEAKLKVVLRSGYNESELKFLDFSVQRRIESVQPIDNDATTVEAYDSCPE